MKYRIYASLLINYVSKGSMLGPWGKWTRIPTMQQYHVNCLAIPFRA